MNINTILETRDGRRIGNAIIIGNEKVKSIQFNKIKTDYGTEMYLTEDEIAEFFYCREQTDDEIKCRGYHKNYVTSEVMK